ncbi:hypothetical protein [Rhizobium sp. AN80A]|uniref:hypothetical protein n=1 Tax=Rhizobium sp. AN80A TaxID=3040673 RepID=UPI0024B33130|nr:hypothetical protein [Rhizobium sp. AN80A]
MATSPVAITSIVVAVVFSEISVAVMASLGALRVFCTAPRFAVTHIRVTSEQAVVPALTLSIERVDRACGQKSYADCDENVSHPLAFHYSCIDEQHNELWTSVPKHVSLVECSTLQTSPFLR